MRAGEICKRNAVTVRPLDGLVEAARLMREKQVGYLIVVKPGLEAGTSRPVGVITHQDIVVTVVARGADPSTLKVEEVMTANPVMAKATESIERALPRMRKAAVRRVPVVGRQGELIGVLSFDDVFDLIADNMRKIVSVDRDDVLSRNSD